MDKNLLLGLAGSLEREAIRPHVLGNFSDMLLAVEQHPAMLLYLDNHLSVGPNSKAARNVGRRHAERKIGINENLARETLELHTLGVGGGYTQADVTSYAEVITGWSIGGERGRRPQGEPGKFMFRAELHEPGAKVVLGKRYADTGYDQGVAVLRDLANNHSTARFIATKLARHFIADDPPSKAIERIAQAYHDAAAAICRRSIAPCIESPDAWAEPLAKYKTPSDYIVSTFRGLQIPADAGSAPLAPVRASWAAHLWPGLAGRLAGSKRRLGWRVGAHEAHRMGRCRWTESGQPARCGGPRAATAGRNTDEPHPYRDIASREWLTGGDADVGRAGVHAAIVGPI